MDNEELVRACLIALVPKVNPQCSTLQLAEFVAHRFQHAESAKEEAIEALERRQTMGDQLKKHGGMVPVQLETEEGKLVFQGLVPEFDTVPTVLFWGARTFVFDRSVVSRDSTGLTRTLHYRERFAVTCVLDRDGKYRPDNR